MTGATAARPPSGRVGLDLLVLGALLGVAALLRLPGLEARGAFDADQGRTMLALEAWLRSGDVPLLGPPASVGGFHHGVLYYYLLAPAALIGGLEPGAVIAVVALAGIATVGLVWFAARSIGGPVAGLVAGLFAAVSASEVARSTSLWNPNIVPAGVALVVAAGWTAWEQRRPGWWLVAAAGAAIALHGHLLSLLVVGPLAALAVADLARSRGAERRRTASWLAGAALVVGLTYLPLLVEELQAGFAEARGVAAFVGGGGGSEAPTAWTVLVIVLRVASWTLVGLPTRAPGLAFLVAAALVVGVVWLAAGGARPPADDRADEKATGRWAARRTAVRWLGGSLGLAVLGLVVAGRALATVVEALPVNQYHAAADPVVLVLVGIAVGALWTALGQARPGARADRAARTRNAAGADQTAGAHPVGGPSGRSATIAATTLRGVLVTAVAGLVLWNLASQPPTRAPDAWPAVEAAARRAAAALPAEGPVAVRSVPTFTAPDAYVFALHAIGRPAAGPPPDSGLGDAAPPAPNEAAALLVICDDRFAAPTGQPCNGPAEAAWLGEGRWRLVDRFEAVPGRVLSIYRPARAD